MESTHLNHLRKTVLCSGRQLKKKGLVKKNEDVIEHLLTCFLKHAKSIFERDHDLDAQSMGKLPLQPVDYCCANHTTVEITFIVPVCWSATANAVMRTCLQAAMKTARFGTDDIANPSLFMLYEAEAAAMYALTADNIILNVRAPLRRTLCCTN